MAVDGGGFFCPTGTSGGAATSRSDFWWRGKLPPAGDSAPSLLKQIMSWGKKTAQETAC